MNVLLLAYAPEINASARINVFQYEPVLRKVFRQVRASGPSDSRLFRLFLYPNPHRSLITKALRKIFLNQIFYFYGIVLPRRILDLACVPFYDVIVIQIGLFSYLAPPILEWMAIRIGRLFGRKIVYTFDDAMTAGAFHGANLAFGPSGLFAFSRASTRSSSCVDGPTRVSPVASR